jgi:hypothetical protein
MCVYIFERGNISVLLSSLFIPKPAGRLLYYYCGPVSRYEKPTYRDLATLNMFRAHTSWVTHGASSAFCALYEPQMTPSAPPFSSATRDESRGARKTTLSVGVDRRRRLICGAAGCLVLGWRDIFALSRLLTWPARFNGVHTSLVYVKYTHTGADKGSYLNCGRV